LETVAKVAAWAGLVVAVVAGSVAFETRAASSASRGPLAWPLLTQSSLFYQGAFLRGNER
jgi:hypothetical protein